MYCLHNTAGHDAWHAEHEAKKAGQRGEALMPPGINNTGEAVGFIEQPSEPKKLTLSFVPF